MRVMDVDTTLVLRLQDIFKTCQFGKYHRLFNLRLCLDHCSLRGNLDCMAVEFSEQGTIFDFLQLQMF